MKKPEYPSRGPCVCDVLHDCLACILFEQRLAEYKRLMREYEESER